MAIGDKIHLINKEEVQGAIGNISNPLLDLPLNNSLAMKQGVGSVTFSRSTTATYIDRYGILRTADVDEPRFEKAGLLLEGSSTNLLTYSEEFDNSAWTKSQCTVTADAAAAPDGTDSADKLAPESDDADHTLIYEVYSTDVTVGDTYTTSVFVKKGNADNITLNTFFMDEVEYNYSFTFSSETTSNSNMKVQKLANGWYRLSYKIVATEDKSDSSIRSRVWGIGRYVDGTTDDYNYVWGFQLEKLPFASSHIPTTDSAVTRSGDVCEVTFEGNYPADLDSMTSIIDINIRGTNKMFAKVVNTGSYNQLISDREVNSNRTYLYKQNGTSTETVLAPTIPFRYGGVFDAQNHTLSMYHNGIMVKRDLSSSSSKPNFGKIVLGDSNTYLNIRNFKIWDKALTATEVALA